MSFICHIHNYTEYNEEWNVFSAFNPSKCTRGLHGLKTEARTRPVPEIVWPDPTRAAQLNLEPEPDPKSDPKFFCQLRLVSILSTLNQT